MDLAFNASNTQHVIFGKYYFEHPKWFLNGIDLKCDKYLGAILSKKISYASTRDIEGILQGFFMNYKVVACVPIGGRL